MVTNQKVQKPIRTVLKNKSTTRKYRHAYVHVLQSTTEVKKDTKQLAVNAAANRNNQN